MEGRALAYLSVGALVGAAATVAFMRLSRKPAASSRAGRLDERAPAVVVYRPSVGIGARLCAELSARGIAVVRVVPAADGGTDGPQAEADGGFGPRAAFLLRHPDDAESVSHRIREGPYDVRFVLAGSAREEGLDAVQRLALCLGVCSPRRPLPTSHAANLAALRGAGVRTPRSVVATRRGDVSAFVRELRMAKFALVVKSTRKNPPARGLGPRLCGSLETAVSALALHGAAVVQERVGGDEFVVDCVTLGGEHKVTALWRYVDFRGGSATATHAMELFETGDGAREAALAEAAARSLGAVAMPDGPSYLQVVWSSDEDAPVVVDLSFGLHSDAGMRLPALAEVGVGYTQLSVLADAARRPDYFALLPQRPGRLHARCAEVPLFRSAKGKAPKEGIAARLRALPTLIDFSLREEALKRAPRAGAPTFADRIGAAYFAGRSAEAVEADMQRIAAWDV